MFFCELLKDLNRMQMGRHVCITDKKGVVVLSGDPVAFKKMKHILRATQFVRDLCTRSADCIFVCLEWISLIYLVSEILLIYSQFHKSVCIISKAHLEYCKYS